LAYLEGFVFAKLAESGGSPLLLVEKVGEVGQANPSAAAAVEEDEVPYAVEGSTVDNNGEAKLLCG
jgi:hypothetical protein